MNQNTIFSKTEAGLREVQTRSAGFPIRLRQILIMIDGHKRFDDLLALQPDATELEKQLNQLMELLLIIDSGADDLRPPVARPAPAPISVAPTIATATAPVAAATSNGTRPMPSANARQKIRRIIAMTDQAYLSNKLEFMLTDVFDAMSSAEDLSFCIDRWQKAMKDAGHGDMVDAYLFQIKSAMAG
ncbi:hypothetical protein [Deefgea rivuli]|uniref:hypothetical protein n=1 Tax=Deefgea rivuli TaxID=400948 RepID=UPI000488725D|nr:hypothetical protein [Deefgea rivuli]